MCLKYILNGFTNVRRKILLGCETYACDYNPISVLILKCTLEYPQKYRGEIGF